MAWTIANQVLHPVAESWLSGVLQRLRTLALGDSLLTVA